MPNWAIYPDDHKIKKKLIKGLKEVIKYAAYFQSSLLLTPHEFLPHYDAQSSQRRHQHRRRKHISDEIGNLPKYHCQKLNQRSNFSSKNGKNIQLNHQKSIKKNLGLNKNQTHWWSSRPTTTALPGTHNHQILQHKHQNTRNQ